MCTNWLMAIVFSSLTISGFAAGFEERMDERPYGNTTETVLTTIFLGDVERSIGFIKQLGNSYTKFLNWFVQDEYCNKAESNTEVCKELQKIETEAVQEGKWATKFHLNRAEFSQELDGKNIGTYNFVRNVNIQHDHFCDFYMQLTVVLTDLNFPIQKEFFSDCDQ